jgi:hypothetical protein
VQKWASRSKPILFGVKGAPKVESTVVCGLSKRKSRATRAARLDKPAVRKGANSGAGKVKLPF